MTSSSSTPNGFLAVFFVFINNKNKLQSERGMINNNYLQHIRMFEL